MQTGKAISIPSILKVGNGTLNKIGEYLKNEGLSQTVIFFGNGLIELFAQTVIDSLNENEIKILAVTNGDQGQNLLMINVDSNGNVYMVKKEEQ